VVSDEPVQREVAEDLPRAADHPRPGAQRAAD